MITATYGKVSTTGRKPCKTVYVSGQILNVVYIVMVDSVTTTRRLCLLQASVASAVDGEVTNTRRTSRRRTGRFISSHTYHVYIYKIKCNI